jgi:uncharacterized membrane protein (UPF0127 family)
MERQALAADAGMVFVFEADQQPDAGFWMFRTHVALDIAYFDADGRIVAILAMQPCDSPNPRLCRSYPPNTPYRGALEMNQGWFASHGVAVGDRIFVEPPL